MIYLDGWLWSFIWKKGRLVVYLDADITTDLLVTYVQYGKRKEPWNYNKDLVSVITMDKELNLSEGVTRTFQLCNA